MADMETMDEGMHQAPPSGAGDSMGEGSSDNCVYIPGDFPGAADLNPGDTITLKITGKDKDGYLQAEPMGEGDQGGAMPDWKKDLHDTMGSEPTPPSTGPGQRMGDY